MKFTLTIDCDNAAFADEDGETDRHSAAAEVARILSSTAENVAWYDEGGCIDANGNGVGRWSWQDQPAPEGPGQ